LQEGQVDLVESSQSRRQWRWGPTGRSSRVVSHPQCHFLPQKIVYILMSKWHILVEFLVLFFSVWPTTAQLSRCGRCAVGHRLQRTTPNSLMFQKLISEAKFLH